MDLNMALGQTKIFQHDHNSRPAWEKVPLEIVKHIVKWAKSAHVLNRQDVNEYLQENTSGDLMDFAKAVIYFFDRNKLVWGDLEYLESAFKPGHDIIPWGFFQKQLSDPKLLRKLPPPVIDRVLASL